MKRSAVAQVSNLPYRRLPVGNALDAQDALGLADARGLEIRDTADWKSALLARHRNPFNFETIANVNTET